MLNIKRTHTYKAHTHYNLMLDVYLPEDAGVNIPVVVFIHGGALIFGNRNMVHTGEIAAITAEGMAYVSVDYRLAPETKISEIVKDIEDAIAWVRGEGARIYGFDENRVAVLGRSAGGYLALLCGTMQCKPKAIISFYGYGDILGAWYSCPSTHYTDYPPVNEDDATQCLSSGIPTGTSFEERWPVYLRSRQTGSWASLVSGYDPIEAKCQLLPYCPIQNIGEGYPPTLLLHGSADTDVPVEQSLDMYEALMRKGIHTQLLVIPDADHGFDAGWDNKPDELGHVTRFLIETLR